MACVVAVPTGFTVFKVSEFLTGEMLRWSGVGEGVFFVDVAAVTVDGVADYGAGVLLRAGTMDVAAVGDLLLLVGTGLMFLQLLGLVGMPVLRAADGGGLVADVGGEGLRAVSLALRPGGFVVQLKDVIVEFEDGTMDGFFSQHGETCIDISIMMLRNYRKFLTMGEETLDEFCTKSNVQRSESLLLDDIHQRIN